MTKRVLTFVALLLFVGADLMLTMAQPAPPSNLTAVVVGTNTNSLKVKLAWTGSSTMGIWYNVYRKDGALADTGAFRKIRTVGNHMTTFNDFFVQLNKTYSYYVTAVDRVTGESQPSNTVEALIGVPAQTIAKVSGVVTDATTGLPIPHAYVNLFSSTSGFYNITFADSLGNYSVSVSADSYYLYSSAMHYFYQYYNNVTTFQDATLIPLADHDSLIINIALNAIVPPVRYYLTGSVKDSLGTPLRAFVTTYKLRHNSFHFSPRTTRTDSLGNYSLDVMQGDTVVVFANPVNRTFIPEFFDNQNTFVDANRIGISGNVTDINFVLSAKPIYDNGISGTIKDTTGSTVAGYVTAFLKPDTSFHYGNRIKYTVASDSLGNYSLTNLAPGEYILMVHPQGDFRPTFFKYDGSSVMNWRNADSVVVNASGVVSDINFTVRTCLGGGNASIIGLVAQTNGTVVSGALVYAFDANGDVAGYAVTDASGNYFMDGLNPGQYSVNSDKVDYSTSDAKTIDLDYLGNSSGNLSFTLNPDNPTNTETTGINEVASYQLSQNYPNPFNPSTTIRYQIPNSGNVTIKVYNVLGSEVATLVNGFQNSGSHLVTFNAANISSGIYFYTIKAGNFSATKKLVLMK